MPEARRFNTGWTMCVIFKRFATSITTIEIQKSGKTEKQRSPDGESMKVHPARQPPFGLISSAAGLLTDSPESDILRCAPGP